MARSNKNYPKTKGKGNRGRSKSKYTEQEKFAYKLGQVMRGLENTQSLISESYNNGKTPKEKKPRRSLY